MVRLIRPSTTRSTLALWVKSLLNAALFFAVFMVALPWAAWWIAPASWPVPAWLGTIGGCALVVGGSALWFSCLDAFSRCGRGTPFPLDAPSRLVQTGPFAVVRNPIMAAEMAIIWGEALYVACTGIIVYAAAMTVAAHLLVAYVEEPELRTRFGSEYADYAARVPRWVPRLWRRGRA